MRVLLSVVSLGALAAVVGTALAEPAETTRIETRPIYGGAVVSVEHGVRVYRPVPPTQRVIINPDGRTPLALIVEGMSGAMRR